MQAIGKITTQVLESPTTTEENPPQNGSLMQSTQTELAEFSAEQAKLVKLELGRNLMVQNTYGRITPEDLPVFANSLLDDLRGYEVSKIIEAIAKCRRRDDNFPTLASILRYLDPQPTYSASVYNEFINKRKSGAYLTSDEKEYIQRFEEKAMRGG